MPLAPRRMRRLALSGLTPLFTGGPTLAHNLSRNRCPSPFPWCRLFASSFQSGSVATCCTVRLS